MIQDTGYIKLFSNININQQEVGTSIFTANLSIRRSKHNCSITIYIAEIFLLF